MSRTPKSLYHLYRTNRQAAVVWLALSDLSKKGNSRVVRPSRVMLAELTGIKSLRSITDALSALVKARWIKRRKIMGKADGKPFSVLKITLIRDALLDREKRQKTANHGTSVIGECAEKPPITLSKDKDGDSAIAPSPEELPPLSGVSSSKLPLEGEEGLDQQEQQRHQNESGVGSGGNPESTEFKAAYALAEDRYRQRWGLEAITALKSHVASKNLSAAVAMKLLRAPFRFEFVPEHYISDADYINNANYISDAEQATPLQGIASAFQIKKEIKQDD